MADFTILRPWWFILLFLPLIFIYIDFAKANKLQNFIREDLMNYLKSQHTSMKPQNTAELRQVKSDELAKSISERARLAVISKPKLWKKFGWLLVPYVFAVFAMSGPAISQSDSMFQNDENWVWIIDSSLSMLAKDLEPNRFQRARYSLIELLNASKVNRRIGLIAYAGDNYLITPPTDDTTSILFALQDLDPSIIPSRGSDPLPALQRAVKILDENDDAETPGNILLVLDDIKDEAEANRIIEYINNDVPYPVYIYAIGTSHGSPIQVNGELLQDKNGAMVMANSHLELIQRVAKQTGSKVYFEIGEEAPHLEKMYSYAHPKYKKTAKSEYLEKDIGYWFLFASLASCLVFVRNYFFVLLLAASLFTFDASTKEVWAADKHEVFTMTMTEDDAATHPNEYGYQLYKAKRYDEAIKYLTDPLWRGNTYYRLGRYDKALQEYQLLGNDADAKYNIGNCFAMMKTPKALSDALIAYDQALELKPNHADASLNKTIILEYLRKLRELTAANAKKEQHTSLIDENGRIIEQDYDTNVMPGAKTTSLLQRRLILQQRKKNPKVMEQSW